MKGVFFDFCGTLFKYVDLEKAWSDWQEVVFKCFKRFGLKMEKNKFLEYCNPHILDGDEPQIDFEGTVLEKKFKKFSLEIGMELSKAEVCEVAKKSVFKWGSSLKIEENTLNVLNVLKKKYKLGVVSNFDHPPFIRFLLSEHNMENLFDSIVISGEVGVKKPNKEIFNIALKEAVLKPEEVIYVGDGKEDIIGAKAAKIVPILIKRDKKEKINEIYDGVKIISSLEELQNIREE